MVLGVQTPLLGIHIDKINYLGKVRSKTCILRHRRRREKDTIKTLRRQFLHDLIRECLPIKQRTRKRRLSENSSRGKKQGWSVASKDDLNRGTVLSERRHIRQVVGVIHKTTEMDRMALGELLNLVKGPNLLSFVWRIGKAVCKVKNFHFRFRSLFFPHV